MGKFWGDDLWVPNASIFVDPVDLGATHTLGFPKVFFSQRHPQVSLRFSLIHVFHQGTQGILVDASPNQRTQRKAQIQQTSFDSEDRGLRPWFERRAGELFGLYFSEVTNLFFLGSKKKMCHSHGLITHLYTTGRLLSDMAIQPAKHLQLSIFFF